MKKREPIDFVITWVDGNDLAWRDEKRKYSKAKDDDDREERYRDWGILKYWFRGVEKYAPWVRKVHFVTWGHVPEWLNVEHAKLHIVSHEDFIPQEYLPTFNANPIEIFLHQIEDLSECFVYFNDDMFCINKVEPEDFFVGGKPCDMLAFQPVIANPENPVMSHMYMNNSLVIAKHFDKRQNVKRQPGNYFKVGYPLLYFCYNLLEMAFPRYTGFYTVHNPYSFCRGTFEELWEKEKEILSDTASHKFRSKDDVTLYLFREWQKLKGEFKAKNVTKDFAYFNIGENDESMYKTICGQKKKMICINDANRPIDFEKTKEGLKNAFEKILPDKSTFER